MRVSLVGSQEEEDLYNAELKVEYGGRSYTLRVRRLLRRPSAIDYRLEGEYLLIELRDHANNPIATCCIHRGHLDRGCVECPSLALPPRED
ncbi:MAG: hypothetical protein DSY37_00725 [Hyperthermus sp.]|nr:MAG: hypothetical protein DSY37_00725 [Hyperthermus sp.]